MNRYVTLDHRGTARGGPFGAWWAWLTPADHAEIPRVRLRAWNVAALAFAVGAVYAARHFGVLGQFLTGLAVIAAATVAGIAYITWDVRRDAERRRAATWAAYRREQTAAAPEPADVPVEVAA